MMIPRYYEDLSILHDNTMPMRSYYIPASQKMNTLIEHREDSDRFQLLNGVWKFQYYKSVYDLKEAFYRTSFNTKDFDDITVPGVWQIAGYDSPQYTNIRYPFPFDPPYLPQDIPCGAYVRKFTYHENIDAPRIYLNFEGVDSCFFVWLNGKYTGYSQVPHATAEFDVTEQHSRITYKHSINGMKNSVRAYINSDTDGHLPAIEYILQDQDNARRYGKLQANFSVQADDQSRIGELAKNELEDKDKLHREISCVMIGNISARKNRVMYIEDEYTGLKCKVRIASVKHTINNGVWCMELTFNTLKSDELSNLASQKIHREDVNIGGEDALNNKNKRPNYEKIWNCAKQYLGVPYVWGGYSPKGFDCSGFVCYVLNQSGAWNCGRLTAQGLYNATKRVKTLAPGDLVFWSGTYKTSSYITHVGICIGNGKNIQAGGAKVQISSNKGAIAYGRF